MKAEKTATYSASVSFSFFIKTFLYCLFSEEIFRIAVVTRPYPSSTKIGRLKSLHFL